MMKNTVISAAKKIPSLRIKELKAVMVKREEKKNIIAKQRDDIRELYGEIDMLLEAFDGGIEGLEDGLLSINYAINSISEVV